MVDTSTEVAVRHGRGRGAAVSPVRPADVLRRG